MLADHSQGTETEIPPLLDSSSFPTPDKASDSPPPIVNVDPDPDPLKSSPTTNKGYGLKKWRRIRREITKDATINLDSTKMLKRGPANILDPKQPNDGDGSVSSTNAFVQSPGDADHLTIPESSSSCRLPVETTFSAGADSDNSDDRSSKSSTAASAPKFRYDACRAVGHQKHRVKNLGARNLGSVSVGPRGLSGKGLADTSKKPRGESIKLEKENSLSSMESDSRSSNSVFIRGTSSILSDPAQNGRPINSDGEDAYDEPTCEEQSAGELRADCSNNASLSQSNSCAHKGNSKHYQLSRDCDPIVNSIQMLQSAQVALEREVQKFGEIGKGIRSLCDDSSDNTGGAAYFVSPSTEVCNNRWNSLFNDAYLNNNVHTVKQQLSEAEVRLKEKEFRIVELEATIKNMDSFGQDRGKTVELQPKICQEMEADLDSLFKQKVEAEVEYLAITRSTKELTILVKDQIKLLQEQKTSPREQAQSLRTMADVKNKAAMPQGQGEELDAVCRQMAGSEEVSKMQRRVSKITVCLTIQLISLLLVFGLFLLQLLPKSAVVVPT